MTQPTFNEYLKALKSKVGLLASIGFIVPGLSYFTRYAPPYLPHISIFTSAIALAIIVITFYLPPKNARRGKLPHNVRMAIKVIATSIFLMILYQVFFKVCTVTHPKEGTTFQIGFGLMKWSLTDPDGRNIIEKHPEASKEEIVDKLTLWGTDKVKRIWTNESIVLSGIMMVIIYIASFGLWTFGWALLAKQMAKDRQIERINR
jgi:hypothetical protein